MRPLWKKMAAIGFLVFLSLWVVGSLRGLTLPYPPPPALGLSGGPTFSPAESASRLPVANNLKQLGMGQLPLPLVLDQPDVERIRVYERTAELALGSAAFDDDEAVIRSAVASHQGTIFNEKKSGLAPERRLALEIGVPPDRFEALLKQLRQIGQLDSVTVQQQDRTAEFRRLHAQRQSLKKYLESVLKHQTAKNLSIEETLKLEQKKQEIEKDLQSLSVHLGDFLGKESFYHLRVTLFEYQPGSKLDRTYTLPQRIFHAFVWALGWWFVVALTATVLGGIYLSVHTLWPRLGLLKNHPASQGGAA
jgi:hypothetical protein